MNYIGNILIIIGSFFYFVGALGLYRMPDFFNRAQAGTKATTLGTFSLLLGVGLINLVWLPKLLIVIVFVAITNPVGSSVLARSAYRNNVEKCEKTQFDQMEGLYEKEDLNGK